MKNKLVMAMITVVLASECFAGCSKKTIENSAASNASVLEENEKETENAVSYRITCNNGNQRTLINP